MRASLCRQPVTGQVIDELRASSSAPLMNVDSSPKERQPKRYSPGASTASVVPKCPLSSIGQVQPAVVRLESRRPNDRTDFSIPQVEFPR